MQRKLVPVQGQESPKGSQEAEVIEGRPCRAPFFGCQLTQPKLGLIIPEAALATADEVIQ
jgi:hypothetical protein